MQAVSTLLEVTLHTLLCVRGVYPPSTFARRRAHGVPVYQSRHPDVRSYIANVVQGLSKDLELGLLRRVTVVIKAMDGLPLERFIIDFGFMQMDALDGGNRDARWVQEHGARRCTSCGLGLRQADNRIIGAPSAFDLDLLLRGFLVRLVALDSQLQDLRGETTWNIVAETHDGREPTFKGDGVSIPTRGGGRS